VRVTVYRVSDQLVIVRSERRDTTDPALLRVILKVQDGAGGRYWWVQCSACDCAWQVPHYAAESVG
jgi:hypothetical protein